MELEGKTYIVRSWKKIFREGERFFAQSDRSRAAETPSNLMIKTCSRIIHEILKCTAFFPHNTNLL